MNWRKAVLKIEDMPQHFEDTTSNASMWPFLCIPRHLIEVKFYAEIWIWTKFHRNECPKITETSHSNYFGRFALIVRGMGDFLMKIKRGFWCGGKGWLLNENYARVLVQREDSELELSSIFLLWPCFRNSQP
jgi:hypothetical protein